MLTQLLFHVLGKQVKGESESTGSAICVAIAVCSKKKEEEKIINYLLKATS